MASLPAVSEVNDDPANNNTRHPAAELVLPGSMAQKPIPIGQPGSPYIPVRSELLKEAPPKPSRRVPGQLIKFDHDAQESHGSPLTELPLPEPHNALQEQLNRNTNKAGLCIICSCMNPQQGKPIVGCTSPEKMSKCFGDDLGFSVFQVRSHLSKEKMSRLLHDFGTLKIPKACGKQFRFFFYFFGHGNSTHICLTDGNFACSKIISEVQKIDLELCKIVLFESCRVKAIQSPEKDPKESSFRAPMQETEKGGLGTSTVLASLPGETQWEEKGQYPQSINTLVIYATEHTSKAYYHSSHQHPEMKGCGLVTYFFTKLASSLNQPLSAVLTEVRQRVDSFIKENSNCPRRNFPQVLVFEDRLMVNVNLFAESKGQERVKPRIVHIKPTPNVTTVQWVFRLNVDKRIQEFRVICRDELGEQVDIAQEPTLKNVAEIKNWSLQSTVKYSVKVLAVYEDGFESESEESSFKLFELQCAKITHIELTRLHPPTLDVQWSIEDHQAQLQPIKYEVFATRDSTPIKTVDQGTRTMLEDLNYETQYFLTVDTCYEGEVTMTSEVYSYTTPTKNDMKPIIECCQPMRNSVVVRVSEPPVIQKRDQFHANNIHLQRIEIWRTPVGSESAASFRKHKVWEGQSDEDKPTTQQVILAGNMPGKTYRVKSKVKFSSGEECEYDHDNPEAQFDSAKPHFLQRLFCAPYCVFFMCLALCLLYIGSAMSYIPYQLHLKGSDGSNTYYALKHDAIECGIGSSLQFEGINLRGSLQEGDSMNDVNAWLVREYRLKLYHQMLGPFYTGYKPLPGDHYVQLLGWSVYLWKGSKISGYCCVQNENGTERMSSLFLFTTAEDSLQFRAGGPPENYILRETVSIPNGDFRCFTELVESKQIITKKSSYYFFVVQFSADNMNFSSEVKYLQNFVNTSDYSNQHTFQYNTQIYLKFPRGATHPTDYTTICRAPADYFAPNGTTHPEAESLHIESRGVPYKWTHIFIAILPVAIAGALVFCVACTCILHYFKLCNVCILCCADHWQHRSSFCYRRRYGSLN